MILSNVLLTCSSTACYAQQVAAHSRVRLQYGSLLQWVSHQSLHSCCLGSANSISNLITSLSNNQSWNSASWWSPWCYHGWFMALCPVAGDSRRGGAAAGMSSCATLSLRKLWIEQINVGWRVSECVRVRAFGAAVHDREGGQGWGDDQKEKVTCSTEWQGAERKGTLKVRSAFSLVIHLSALCCPSICFQSADKTATADLAMIGRQWQKYVNLPFPLYSSPACAWAKLLSGALCMCVQILCILCWWWKTPLCLCSPMLMRAGSVGAAFEQRRKFLWRIRRSCKSQF